MGINATDFRLRLFGMRSGSDRDSISATVAERGIAASYESMRLWRNEFGPKKVLRRLAKELPRYGDTRINKALEACVP